LCFLWKRDFEEKLVDKEEMEESDGTCVFSSEGNEVTTMQISHESISRIVRGRIIWAHASTKETVLSSSNGVSLNRGEEDALGLKFQEWTPDVDTLRPPVAMLINSSELRAAGFKLKEVKCILQDLRQMHVVACGHEERDCEVLRTWPLKGLFCQWMITRIQVTM
jgi:hypothetical protein